MGNEYTGERKEANYVELLIVLCSIPLLPVVMACGVIMMLSGLKNLFQSHSESYMMEEEFDGKYRKRISYGIDEYPELPERNIWRGDK